MENNDSISVEQSNVSAPVAEASKISLGSETGDSTFGKFNNANDLLNAYNELESAFTRKCQRVKELETNQSTDNDKLLSNDLTPVYEKSDWQAKIGEFLETHPLAKTFSRQIADELYNDKTLAISPSSVELAYSRVLAKNYKSSDDMIADSDFIDNHILNNQKITDKVIQNYLKNYNSSPSLISGKSGSIGLAPKYKAKTLADAKSMVEKLFN